MSAITKALAIVTFVLATVAGADAAPAVVHIGSTTGGAGSTLSASLSGAPANGNIVLASGVIGTTSRTVKDSNLVSLAVHASTLLATNFSDYVASGSPTATYTASANAVIDLGLIEISGASLASANYCNASAATCAVTTSVGDVVVCDAYGGSTTVTISNAGAVTYIFQDATNLVAMGYAIASAGSSVCGSTSAGQISGADYAAASGGGSSASPVAPASGVYPGGYPPYYAFLR